LATSAGREALIKGKRLLAEINQRPFALDQRNSGGYPPCAVRRPHKLSTKRLLRYGSSDALPGAG
jgi:hypothetical protein